MENFLAAAVVSVLAIRIYLAFSYRYLIEHVPIAGQLALDQFHIAHLLWGGLFMLAAFLIAFTFLGRPALGLAAVVGGIGFGIFIDEIGKFITRDNNYFFRPAVALIYVTFIALFIGLRAVQRPWVISQRAALANALAYAQQAVIRDFRVEDQRHALDLLDRCDQNDPLVAHLRTALEGADTRHGQGRNVATRSWGWLRQWYARLVRAKGFGEALIGLFIAQSIYGLYQTFTGVDWSASLIVLLAGGATALVLFAVRVTRSSARSAAWELVGLAVLIAIGILLHLQTGPPSFAHGLQVLSATVSSVLVAFGIVMVRKSLLGAYWMFHRALLVNILVTQVFAFYEAQIFAVVGLSFHIASLMALRFMMSQEMLRQAGNAPRAVRTEAV